MEGDSVTQQAGVSRGLSGKLTAKENANPNT